jgi:formylglycine-generating enzyme required for sulfatase activity
VTRARLILPALLLVLCAGSASAQSARADSTARPFKDCEHCPAMVAVPPGAVGRARLDYRFAYSRDKISARDWKQCVVAGQCQALGAASAAGPEPAAASWLDIQQYLSWLSLETGHDYRLLSETEWEYLTTAGALRADALEWTSDCWHPDRVAAPLDGSSWDAEGDCRYHVARGRRAGESSTATRYRFLFNASDRALGFRVARTLEK